jgi:hypothetical protein
MMTYAGGEVPAQRTDPDFGALHHSLSGIMVEIGLLRHGLEALATKVRQHDEQLKAMRGRSTKPR